MTVREIVQVTGGVWQGDESRLDAAPLNIVTDSRQASEGSLFLALRGEKTDGHRYIGDVLRKGALAVLCEEEKAGEPRIVVPHVLPAMQRAAAWNRDRFGFSFIGVTGSVGKTTAKEMIASVLSARLRTFKTPGSMNGQIGIPVSLMGLDDHYDAAVIEMGISLHGEMEKIARIVRPTMAVFTNIGDAHLEAFHDRRGVLREKSEILKGMDAEGVVICNGDDPLLRGADFGRRRVLFGLGKDCEVRAEDIESPDGISLSCTILSGGRRFSAWVPAYGDYMIYAVLAAAAVGFELGLTDAEIAAGLRCYKTVGHRSRVVDTGSCLLIDDCYNANPTSTRSAIDSMQHFPGRKVCILGDMREMGENSRSLHEEIGRYAAGQHVDLLLTQGEDSVYTAAAAGEIALHFDDKASLIEALPTLLHKGDVVLVKASHSLRFEEIVDSIENLSL